MIKPLNGKTSTVHIHRSQLAVNDSKTEHISILQAKRITKVIAIGTALDGESVVNLQEKQILGDVSLNFGFENVINIPIYANTDFVHLKKEGTNFDNEQYTGNTFKTCTSLKNSDLFTSVEVKLYVFYEY